MHRPALLFLVMVSAFFPGSLCQADEKTSAEVLAQQGQALAQEGNDAAAIDKYRQALEVDPELDALRFLLAHSLIRVGHFAAARPEFSALVLTNPDNGAARHGEITSLIMLERYPEARRKLEEGLGVLPRDGQLAHTLARLLATAPDDAVRDGPLALRLATVVYRIKKLPETAETLAMAAAETGDFSRAIEIQREVIAEAEEGGAGPQVLARQRQRLNSYQAAHPWRAESAQEIAMATEPPRIAPKG